MTKVLAVHQNGYVWHIPAEKIAENYANYYFSNHTDCSYDEEFQACMEDDYTMSDWFGNNMDLEDVIEYAVLVKRPTPQETVKCDEDWDYDFENM